MNRQIAEKTINEYLKPIYGFALKNCTNLQDAEDLSQEIILKAFRALLRKDDIGDVKNFIWTVAHNALCNYYRENAKNVSKVNVYELSELVYEEDYTFSEEEDKQILERLKIEIAYLSKIQRKIIISYYFENRKQTDIASELGIPLGTVKWHLFEAKKELKRGIGTMRKSSELKFNPIKFHSYGINGSSGTKSPDSFFRSILSQNICYSVRNEAKDVNEIADDLGVSPVYVENEAEYLEEYGFLKLVRGKYIVNFIISEPNEELLVMQNAMYKKAAKIFANELYDELVSSGILKSSELWCRQTDGKITIENEVRADDNFILWSVIPFIAAISGETLMDDRIKFEEVATIRPDAGHNIFHASVISDAISLPEDYAYMKNWCGPMWNQSGDKILWQIDSEWSDRGEDSQALTYYSKEAKRVLSLYEREKNELLSRDEYAWLAEKGYVKICGDFDNQFKSSWQIVVLSTKNIKEKLLDIGNKIKKKYSGEFEKIKEPYVKATLEAVPKHLRRVREYELQFVFHSDGLFLCHCIVELLSNGKLSPPSEEQRKSICRIIFEK
ncbi:MAG: RNA polymerase sigma factor [Ruminococcaceae bacterium]|nr:RNA polymerase sigma factor [Oscillospiraceae bacterium]